MYRACGQETKIGTEWLLACPVSARPDPSQKIFAGLRFARRDGTGKRMICGGESELVVRHLFQTRIPYSRLDEC